MEIIVALLMFNCNLHLNQDSCVDTHLKCIETMSTIKINTGNRCVSKEQRIAASYLYCVETGGDVNSELDYVGLVESMHSPYNPNRGWYLWEKPGYWEKFQENFPAKTRCN